MKKSEPYKLSKSELNNLVINFTNNLLESTNVVDADDGPNTFITNFNLFNKINKQRAIDIGYSVIQSFLDGSETGDWIYYPDGPVNSVSYFPAGEIGKTTNTNQIDNYTRTAYDDWFKHVTRKYALLGYHVVDTQLDRDEFLSTKRSYNDYLELTENINHDIQCKNCNHSWNLETDDSNPYLCHRCAWDNLNNNFDYKSYWDWKNSLSESIVKKPLTPLQRVQRKWNFQKNKKSILLKRKRTEIRKKTPEQLKKRAIKLSYNFVRDKIVSKLFGYHLYDELTIVQKEKVLNILSKRKKKINKLAKFVYLPRLIDKENMKFRQSLDEKMTLSQLKSVEKYAEKQLSPEDIEFTRHFFDRINDPRNGKEITDAELTGFFKRLSRVKSKFKEFLEKYEQIVVKDKRSNINIPFLKQANQIIAKTIMRKQNFQTSNQTLQFEGVSGNMSLSDIANKHEVRIDILKDEFKKGISVEMEHTSNINVASRIALDHLFEDPYYYTKLSNIHENFNIKKKSSILKESGSLPGVEPIPASMADSIIKDFIKKIVIPSKSIDVSTLTGLGSTRAILKKLPGAKSIAGDLDLLAVAVENRTDSVKKLTNITKTLGLDYQVAFGNVFSVAYPLNGKKYQVDLMIADATPGNAAYDYMRKFKYWSDENPVQDTSFVIKGAHRSELSKTIVKAVGLSASERGFNEFVWNNKFSDIVEISNELSKKASKFKDPIKKGETLELSNILITFVKSLDRLKSMLTSDGEFIKNRYPHGVFKTFTKGYDVLIDLLFTKIESQQTWEDTLDKKFKITNAISRMNKFEDVLKLVQELVKRRVLTPRSVLQVFTEMKSNFDTGKAAGRWNRDLEVFIENYFPFLKGRW